MGSLAQGTAEKGTKRKRCHGVPHAVTVATIARPVIAIAAIAVVIAGTIRPAIWSPSPGIAVGSAVLSTPGAGAMFSPVSLVLLARKEILRLSARQWSSNHQ